MSNDLSGVRALKVSSSGGSSIPVLSKAVLPGHMSCSVSCISVSMIVAIQIGAVDLMSSFQQINIWVPG